MVGAVAMEGRQSAVAQIPDVAIPILFVISLALQFGKRVCGVELFCTAVGGDADIVTTVGAGCAGYIFTINRSVIGLSIRDIGGHK